MFNDRAIAATLWSICLHFESISCTASGLTLEIVGILPLKRVCPSVPRLASLCVICQFNFIVPMTLSRPPQSDSDKAIESCQESGEVIIVRASRMRSVVHVGVHGDIQVTGLECESSLLFPGSRKGRILECGRMPRAAPSLTVCWTGPRKECFAFASGE